MKQELKIYAIGAVFAVALMASFLFLGLRAKAASVRDGVHSPVYPALQTIDRQELADMRANMQLCNEVATFQQVCNAVSTFQGVETVEPYSPNDLDLLAALVWAEAGDQDFIGMRIVADCVCNRASDRHPEWPSSISSVIYQPGQFSVVANGRLDQGFYNATPECYEAARLALSGDHYDTNVIYFSMYYCANGVFAYQWGDHFIGY